MYTGAYGVHHVTPGQVDRCGAVEIEIDVGSVSSDDRVNHVHHIAASQIVSFQSSCTDARLAIDIQSSLGRHDLRLHDDPWIHLAKSHAHQTGETDIRVRHERLEPHLAVDRDEDQQRQAEQNDDQDQRVDDEHPPFEFCAFFGQWIQWHLNLSDKRQ